MKFQPHPYHLVEPSPWPLAASIALLTSTVSAVCLFHGYSHGGVILTMGLLAVLSTMGLWWADVIREGTFLGHHTLRVQRGLQLGVILFIVSECFFFLSIFWAFFDAALAPTVELGCAWPPAGIQPIDPWEWPLVNTILLLSSGATATWSHHALIAGDRKNALLGLACTLVLALIFTGIQLYEYYEASFTISDGAFGSAFFFGTGMHGLHVLIGTIFLTVCFYRLINYHLTKHHHVGFEGGLLYWQRNAVIEGNLYYYHSTICGKLLKA
jgi:cytochrome c oxidase subunit 3